MRIDDEDLKILRKDFEDETISELDVDTLAKIFKCLEEREEYKAHSELFTPETLAHVDKKTKKKRR